MKLVRLMVTVVAVFLAGCQTVQQPEQETIVVYGASGKIGGIIVDEALDRGYKVVGVSRSPEKFTVEHENFSGVKGDALNAADMQQITEGAMGVVLSLSGGSPDNDPATTVAPLAAAAAVEAFTGVEDAPHVIQMGGASSIGVTLEQAEEDLPPFAKTNPGMRAMLLGHFYVIENYKAGDIDWTILSPAMNIKGWGFQAITDGETNMETYRTSTTGLVLNEEGKSEIWVRDLAEAVLDEFENRNFVQQQFSVGY